VVGFAEGRAGEVLVCIAEVRVAVVQCIAHASATVNMLIDLGSLLLKFALLKSPSTINAASEYMVSS
jgi:hypothetical protein